MPEEAMLEHTLAEYLKKPPPVGMDRAHGE